MSKTLQEINYTFAGALLLGKKYKSWKPEVRWNIDSEEWFLGAVNHGYNIGIGDPWQCFMLEGSYLTASVNPAGEWREGFPVSSFSVGAAYPVKAPPHRLVAADRHPCSQILTICLCPVTLLILWIKTPGSDTRFKVESLFLLGRTTTTIQDGSTTTHSTGCAAAVCITLQGW